MAAAAIIIRELAGSPPARFSVVECAILALQYFLPERNQLESIHAPPRTTDRRSRFRLRVAILRQGTGGDHVLLQLVLPGVFHGVDRERLDGYQELHKASSKRLMSPIGKFDGGAALFL